MAEPAGNILLVITGGIAAYKVLELIRRLRDRNFAVRCVMTRAAGQFVTPLSVSALSENKVYQEVFSLTDEAEMGHIRLSREADLLVVAPASADFLAKMAHGLADDLASTVLLATDKPVLAAPAMNTQMWAHPAVQRNVAQIRQDGIHMVGPNSGDLACGEIGAGRMAEPDEILAAILNLLKGLQGEPRPLQGRRALVTAGPTHEAIDPVRYLGNRSSGKQGYAIAAALAAAGAETILVSGPTALADPDGVDVVRIESAAQMLSACEASLPADIAVCAAAVADWRVDQASEQKLKKQAGAAPPPLLLAENPDILASLARHPKQRPDLVVGFAAETEALLDNARQKRLRKGCDWIVANDVAGGAIMGAEQNEVHLITGAAQESWPAQSKTAVAEALVARMAAHFTLQPKQRAQS